MVNLGINSIFMARNGVVELIPVLEELSYLCFHVCVLFLQVASQIVNVNTLFYRVSQG